MTQDVESILKIIIREAEFALSNAKDEKSRLAWTRQAIKATETYVLYVKQKDIEKKLDEMEGIIKSIDDAMYSISRKSL